MAKEEREKGEKGLEEGLSAHPSVEREYKRQLFVVRYRRTVTRILLIIGIVLVGGLVALFVYWLLGVLYPTQPPAEPAPEQPGAEVRIEILSADYVPAGESLYDYAVLIRNASPIWGVSDLEYKVAFVDSSGVVISSITDNDYILPDEEKYLVGTNVELSSVPAEIQVVVSDPFWSKLETRSKPVLDIRQKNLAEGMVGLEVLRVEGNVFNGSDFTYRDVDINVVLLDSSGDLVGANHTTVGALVPGEERYFKTSWFEPLAGAVDQVIIEPSVNIFIPESVLLDEPVDVPGGSSAPQPVF